MARDHTAPWQQAKTTIVLSEERYLLARVQPNGPATIVTLKGVYNNYITALYCLG